jgi:hypothetical protein
MLTSYMVHCPHVGCNWFGSLLPRSSAEAWRRAIPTTPVVVFQCPRCQGEWHARIVGDDVEALPLETTAVTSV